MDTSGGAKRRQKGGARPPAREARPLGIVRLIDGQFWRRGAPPEGGCKAARARGAAIRNCLSNGQAILTGNTNTNTTIAIHPIAPRTGDSIIWGVGCTPQQRSLHIMMMMVLRAGSAAAAEFIDRR